ncbi:MAG: glycosyltransferase family 9 protein [Gammaproteobacteria bacterium]|nr:glycosyltransferase family 9 protein [Gammaproteobacteria bacterium]
MPLPFQSPPTTLCILRLSAIGDVCHTLAVVRSIQTHWPQTKITWIIGALEASLLADIPGIEFIIFDKKKGWAAFAALRHTLRGRHFDALLDMQVALRASLASLLITSPLRIGFDRARAKDMQWLFTNHRIAAQPREHALDALFGFAHVLGVREKILRWDIPVPGAAHAFAQQQLPGEQATLIISPCSSARARNWRNWSAQRYAHVVDYAVERHGMRVLLTGGPARLEREYGTQIVQMARHAPHNLIGLTNLKQLLALLQRGTVLISPDSGPAHMATCTGTPVIGLYATSNPLRTGPYLSQRWVVNKYPEALQIEGGKSVAEVSWGRRVRRPDAMDLITVDEVTQKLDELMAARQR